MSPPQRPVAPITISVVSHGHDGWLPQLLDDLAQTSAGCIARVILTHNLPAPSLCGGGLPFELVQIHNPVPMGFGANHNQAFTRCETDFFAVLNPDIRLSGTGLWAAMLQALAPADVGAVTATLLNADGSLQDNGRALVTPWSLFLRRVLRRREQRVEWFSAAFLLMPAHVYRQLGGFDVGYHMYCEDVDLCLRLQLAGWRLARSEARATHHAQRDSLRQWRPLAWHVRSLMRLWCSAPFWRYLLKQGAPVPRS